VHNKINPVDNKLPLVEVESLAFPLLEVSTTPTTSTSAMTDGGAGKGSSLISKRNFWVIDNKNSMAKDHIAEWSVD